MTPSLRDPRDTVPAGPPDFEPTSDCSRSCNLNAYPGGVPAINAEKTYDDFDDLVYTLDADELDEL